MANRRDEWNAVLPALARGERRAHVRVTGLVMGLLARLQLFDLEDHWDDICQEVLVLLIRSIRSGAIRDPATFVSYCATVTRREAYRWLKRHAQARDRHGAEGPDEHETPEESRSLEADVLVAVARALDSLPEKERLVMDAIYLRGCSYSEAAEQLGIPLGTLKRAQTLALRELREKLGTRR